jgi:hypothetical protein
MGLFGVQIPSTFWLLLNVPQNPIAAISPPNAAYDDAAERPSKFAEPSHLCGVILAVP